MTLNQSNRWACAGAVSAAALIIFHPYTYKVTEFIARNKGYIAENNGRTPSWKGLLLHTIILFFVVFGLLSMDWTCS